jgi:hypothetical protein
MTQVIRVFIGSPGDVREERRHAETAVHELSTRLVDMLDVVLQPVSWPHFAPAAGKAGTPAQDSITTRVAKARIFVGILFTRWGTVTGPGRKESGTEAEFREALLHPDDIEMLTYFRNPDMAKGPVDPAQFAQLNRLKKNLGEAGLFHQPYARPSDFRARFCYDLIAAVLGILSDMRRRQALQSFFLHGTHPRRREPEFLIGYPAVDKHHPAARSAVVDWQERLVPNVVYEDVKAIQKIEEALRHSGIVDVGAVTVDSPALREPGNRVWLCLPRSELATARLRALGPVARFEFGVTPSGARYLKWRPRGAAKAFRIASPLGTYLREQRPGGQQEWQRKFGQIIAKDFAVIARHPLPDSEFTALGGPYYQYFVAGIRGLGTWGAGWFIRHRPDALAAAAESADDGEVTILLEVTFSNFRITNAVDVSHQPATFFEKENRISTVRKNIAAFRP